VSDKNCVTHHNACDCREQMLADCIEALEQALREVSEQWKQGRWINAYLIDRIDALLTPSAAPERQ
jgi:hypothetical protein